MAAWEWGPQDNCPQASPTHPREPAAPREESPRSYLTGPLMSQAAGRVLLRSLVKEEHESQKDPSRGPAGHREEHGGARPPEPPALTQKSSRSAADILSTAPTSWVLELELGPRREKGRGQEREREGRFLRCLSSDWGKLRTERGLLGRLELPENKAGSPPSDWVP